MTNEKDTPAAEQTALAPRPRFLTELAEQMGANPDDLKRIIYKTCLPQGCSAENMAAFLMVASQYRLNPLIREIYAFPTKAGGIQTIVSIDGWLKIINSHPAFDGLECRENNDESGNLASCTCTIWRNDRTKPIIITEYLSECFQKRTTKEGYVNPWEQWPARMLRWKSIIQCGRVAFSLVGIIDEDEAERWRAAGVIVSDVRPPAEVKAEIAQAEQEASQPQGLPPTPTTPPESPGKLF